MTEDEELAVDHRKPGAVFELVSNDLRVDIVRALGEAREPLSFSSLREIVGERDSGKFNYHLRKLVGHFVTQGEQGYRLSIAGEQMYGTMLSGAYTAHATVEPFEFDGPCPLCGNDVLVAEYAAETPELHCPNCEDWFNEFPFPPGSLGEFDRQELPAAFDRWMRTTLQTFLHGFCANCGGRVEACLEQTAAGDPLPIRATYECGRCGEELQASPSLPVFFHSTAVSFFDRHGVDVFRDPTWQFYGPEDEVSVEIVDEEPVRVEVVVTMGAETLRATVGPEVTVERVSIDQ
ncbi:MAG: winged helix-turn-helix domain-containing protein [Halodesulfurarchaeum sp.]